MCISLDFSSPRSLPLSPIHDGPRREFPTAFESRIQNDRPMVTEVAIGEFEAPHLKTTIAWWDADLPTSRVLNGRVAQSPHACAARHRVSAALAGNRTRPPYLPGAQRRAPGRTNTYAARCMACMWGCGMPVEMIIDRWKPDVANYRLETFCYGPPSYVFYRPDRQRVVPDATECRESKRTGSAMTRRRTANRMINSIPRHSPHSANTLAETGVGSRGSSHLPILLYCSRLLSDSFQYSKPLK